jgi:spermidine synthase
VLILDDLRHSYVDLDDPTHLEFWYVRRLADAIDVAVPSGPVDVLHIGGGGLTLPRAVRATRPSDSEQVVLEIDGDLLDLVEEDLGFEPGPGIDVRIGDARLAIDDLGTGAFDVVVGDAFGGRAVPWHLATREFVVEVGRVLRPDGVYAINVIDGPRARFLSAETATLAEVFEHVVVLLGPGAAAGGRGNSVIVATDGDLDTELLGRLALRDGGGVVTDVDAFVDGASVLTDDFAPVDQLLAGGA